MRFVLTRTSSYDGGSEIEIDSLEALLELAKKEGLSLILKTYGDLPEIEVYDDYRE